MNRFPLVLSACLSVASALAGEKTPKVFYAKGGAAAEPGGRAVLAWRPGGEQPIAAWDFGGRTVGGYAVFTVTDFKAQGRDAEGRTVGWPVVRLSYATHPDGLGPKGCFTRRDCAHYLGPTFDNPVLPANVNRHETYTITRTGTYVAPLIQGQERYVRAQLDTPGTEVTIGSLEIVNAGVFSTEPVAGAFRSSDERVNRTWAMSVWTCNLASFPNHDAWRVVAGRLLPRKLERGTCAGLCTKASHAGDGTWSADFELRANPHHDSAMGLILRAEGPEDGVVVAVSQPACCRIYRRKAGVNRLLAQMVVEDRILDGVPCTLEARVKGKTVSARFNGFDVVSATVDDLPAAGKFGIYVEKEWWPVVSAVAVRDAAGRDVFRDDFSGADAEGRLPGWDYTRSFRFMADGAKRDRLVWIGDLWWAARSCFCGYRPDWPYFRESLKLLAYNQTPEGYVWASPFGEIGRRPGAGEYGHFPSDEFSAWFVPNVWEYYLYTADGETANALYPAVAKDLDYLSAHCRADGIFEQRLETSCHACSMDPVDPRHRAYMNFVLHLAYTDGAKLARALGRTSDAARWEAAAAKLAAGVRRAFWDPKGKFFRQNLESPGTWDVTLAMALATGFATPEEALAIAPRIGVNGANKFHLLGLRGKFRYGFDEAAFDMLEGGTWFRLSDPSWEGAQCCTECGFLTRKNWWDESHPDTTAAGVITTYLLGVEPTEPGYRRFRFAPHPVSRLTFAEGRVPTPHGDILARWERKGRALGMTLTVPPGTAASVEVRGAEGLTVDGAACDGSALGPGRHAIAATLGADAMVDRSLASASAPSPYLDAMETALSAYTPERIADYVARVERRGIWEHGFPRLAANLGVLVARGRLPEKKDLLRRLMDICAREMPLSLKRGNKSAGNDFSVKEIACALLELEAAGTFPKAVTDGWRASFAAMKAREIYTCQPKVGDKTARNWCVFGATSEQARLFAGLGGDPDYVERYVSDQLRFFDANGMYRDPGNPMVYDFVTRLQFVALLSFGYDGPSRARLEELLLKSAEPTLRMQAVTGEIPYGGRSNQFLHNDTFYAALCEWYAGWFKRRGEPATASRFRAAARRAMDDFRRATAAKPVRHVKNRFPTETKYGCEDYAYFDKYMVTAGSWAYLAERFADPTIPCAAGPVPDGVFVTSDDFHRVMLNAGGYTAQFDWNAQEGYDANGLGRLVRAGAPSALCLSSPCPVRAHYLMDVTNDCPLAIAPVGASPLRVTKAEPGLVELKDGKSVWSNRLSSAGLEMTLAGEGLQALTLPVFAFDGESRPTVACAGGVLTVWHAGWTYRFATNGTLVDTGRLYGNRNGHYRRFEARADGRLTVKITLEPTGD